MNAFNLLHISYMYDLFEHEMASSDWLRPELKVPAVHGHHLVGLDHAVDSAVRLPVRISDWISSFPTSSSKKRLLYENAIESSD
jgi:hypothetical protein